MDKIMSLQEYIEFKKKIIVDDIIQKFKDEYILNFFKVQNTSPIPKWTSYKKTQDYIDELEKRKLSNQQYNILCSESVLSNPEIISKYNEYVNEESKKKNCKVDRQKEEENQKKEAIQFLKDNFTEGNESVKFLNQVIRAVCRGFDSVIKKGSIQVCEYGSPYHKIENICEDYDGFINECVTNSTLRKLSVWKIAYHYLSNRKYFKEHKKIFEKYHLIQYLWDFLSNHINEIVNEVIKKYPLDDVIRIMNTENPNYKGRIERYIDYNKQKNVIKNGILQKIPDNYIDLFPLARKIHRKFTLHIGGTNSGKTYSAMQELRKCGSGIYLGPLRLLAYEQYDKLNSDGFRCNLKTGEEVKEVEGATFQSSTIEMLDLSNTYDIIVIDEAQLISDKFRGGAWTNAIIGGLSKNIHICAAPEAENVIIKIIQSCGDEYEVIHHTRNTPLILERDMFNFNKDIQKGDALIVFSKKSVHAVATDLKEMKISSSIIYGALPYDVRQNEANKFANGITDVVVTTDAIGLGMNLPIKRVIFLETEKFDGEKVRDLSPQEIKQIAGRAGRYGIFNEGYVNSFSNKKLISNGLNIEISPIEEVYLRFPESLIGIEGNLSFILEQWEKMDAHDGFRKADITHEKKLCKIAEEYTNDKELIYDFITIPFEDDDAELFELWMQMLTAKLDNRHLSLHKVCETDELVISTMNLQELESLYKKYDLMFYYNEKFEESIESLYVMEGKELISNMIIKLLDNQRILKKKCKKCGKKLPWSFKYNVCESCHAQSFYYYDFY